MVRTTREQRKALAKLLMRTHLPDYDPKSWLRHYRAKRRMIRPLFGGDGCIMIEWCGMWLGIEPDGYTHS